MMGGHRLPKAGSERDEPSRYSLKGAPIGVTAVHFVS